MRFELALSLSLTLLACGCNGERERERDVVATIVGEGQTLALDRRVVEHVAARDGVSVEQAEQQALDTLRLVAARRAELAARERPPTAPDDLDPARRSQLERAALVRLWLDEVFEPNTSAAEIPQSVVTQNLANPSITRRLFHPELYFVCQALLVPAERDEQGHNVQPPSEAEAARQWRAAADRAFAEFVARVHAHEPDLLATDDCSLLGQLVAVSERTFDLAQFAGEPDSNSPTDGGASGSVTIRFERFAFAPTQAQEFDADWLAAVTPVRERAIVGPFPSRFGLHLVIIGKIEPARLADGSLPEAELARARELALRSEIEQVYRSDRLQQQLAEIRDRKVVRLAPELERER